jgi:hypothetical protein
MRIINKFIVFSSVLLCISGCGISGHYGNSNIKASNKEKTAKLYSQSFVGKNKSEVLSYYGEPKNIQYGIKHHDSHLGTPNTYTTYDEVWFYKYEEGFPLLWPNQFAIQFYFIDDVVALVTG